MGFATWDFDTAQELFLKPGQATSLAVLGNRSVSRGAVRDDRSLLPPGAQAITGDEQASQVSGATSTPGSVSQYVLLVFAIVSVFVAAFLIYNTFSMLVAQRP